MAVVETRRQPIRVVITQSHITTIGIGTVVMPNIDVVKRGILIGSTTKLGSGSSVVLEGHNLSGSTTLPIATTRVVGTPQMVFTNPIMITHVNRTTNQPLMSSMVVGGYESVDVMYPKGGYQEPSAVTISILDHRNSHYVRLNSNFKYFYFKNNIDPNVHVKMFNSTVKVNVRTSKEYIINAFSYTLKDIT